MPSPCFKCSAECGNGTQSRGVACVYTDNGRMEVADPSKCSGAIQPAAARPCTLKPCGVQWYVTEWSAVSVTKSVITASTSEGVSVLLNVIFGFKGPHNKHIWNKKKCIFGATSHNSPSIPENSTLRISSSLFTAWRKTQSFSLPPKAMLYCAFRVFERECAVVSKSSVSGLSDITNGLFPESVCATDVKGADRLQTHCWWRTFCGTWDT